MTDSVIQTEPPSLADPDRTIDRLLRAIQAIVSDSGVDRVVVNLSGGIDSSLTATLATEALGSGRVTGLILPTAVNRDENIDDARQLAEELVIDYRVIELQPLLDTVVTAVNGDCQEVTSSERGGRKRVTTFPDAPRTGFTGAVGNVAARLRMIAAYFEANTTDAVVLGTGNRTELLLGYFTKWGDGAADALPIGDLYKTEVRTLARALEIDDRIIEKPPTAGLWAGQTDEDELGASYELIDTILANVFDRGAAPEAVAATLDVDGELVAGFLDQHAATAHKRTQPATATDLLDEPVRGPVE